MKFLIDADLKMSPLRSPWDRKYHSSGWTQCGHWAWTLAVTDKMCVTPSPRLTPDTEQGRPEMTSRLTDISLLYHIVHHNIIERDLQCLLLTSFYPLMGPLQTIFLQMGSLHNGNCVQYRYCQLWTINKWSWSLPLPT